MKTTLKTLLGLTACIAVAGIAHATVVIDENGVGFVGKGDVQNAMGWNNAQLQANAASIQFRFVATQQATWVCEWTTGPDHNRTHHEVDREVITALSGNIAYDARKNKKDQITGFNLNGFEGEVENEGENEGGDVGECEGNKTLQAGSIVYGEGDGDAVLEVSIDGIAWLSFDLPIDEIE